MGAPPQSSLDSPNLKDMVLENMGTISCASPSYLNGSLWGEVLEAQKAKLRQTTTRRDQDQHIKKNSRFSMKRRGVIRREGSRRGEIEIRRKVRTLKRLIPSHETSNGSLEGLFKDTAAYIMSLQMRVRVMQTMVDVMTTSQEKQY